MGNKDNRLLLVGVHTGGQFTVVNSVTYAGISAICQSRVHTSNAGSNWFGWEVWSLVNPTVGTNDLTIFWSSAGQPISFGANSWYGVSTGNPISATASTTANSSLGSLSVASSTGNVINDFIATEEALTVYANQTQLWNAYDNGGQYITFGSSYKSATANPMATYWTVGGGGVDWAMISVAIAPSTGGGTAVTPRSTPAPFTMCF